MDNYLTFIIDNQRFAFDAKNVVEVLIDVPINPIPKSADYIIGVINFRGEAVSVVDTSIKFGITNYQINQKRIIIVLNITLNEKQVKLGCLCDAVLRIETINYADIQQVPNFGTYYNPELLKGVFYLKHLFYAIIDTEKIFSSDEMRLLLNNN